MPGCSDCPLIFFDRGSSDWTLTHGLFRRAGLVPNVVLEVETIETAKRMVERDLGLAFLPHLVVSRELRRNTLAVVPLSVEALAFLESLRTAVRAIAAPRVNPARARRRS